MQTFLVRVEVHGLPLSSYPAFHQRMAESGFFRTIWGTNGKLYQLPNATYSFVGNHTDEQVLDVAVALALLVDQQPEVIVARASRCVWKGLKEIPMYSNLGAILARAAFKAPLPAYSSLSKALLKK